MLKDFFQYQFIQNALLASILTSILCGLIGVIIVEKKMLMMSGGIAHTAYGGVGLGYLLNFEPILGALVFAICAAVGVGFIKRKGGVNSDIVISLFWSLGMALGILFISLMNGYPPDMNSYLFGNILSVTKYNIYIMFIITIFVSLFIIMFFEDWKAYLFDEQFSEIIGMKTRILEYLCLVLIALTVVILIKVTGIILSLALLTAPAATATLLSKKLKSRMILSVILGNIFCFAGLLISFKANIPSGATIIIFCVLFYVITLSTHLVKNK